MKAFQNKLGASKGGSRYYEIQSWSKLCQRPHKPLPLPLYNWSWDGPHVHQTSLPANVLFNESTFANYKTECDEYIQIFKYFLSKYLFGYSFV